MKLKKLIKLGFIAAISTMTAYGQGLRIDTESSLVSRDITVVDLTVAQQQDFGISRAFQQLDRELLRIDAGETGRTIERALQIATEIGAARAGQARAEELTFSELADIVFRGVPGATVVVNAQVIALANAAIAEARVSRPASANAPTLTVGAPAPTPPVATPPQARPTAEERRARRAARRAARREARRAARRAARGR